MAYTLITLTCNGEGPDEAALNGTVVATPSNVMTNSGEVVETIPVTGTIKAGVLTNASGGAFKLVAVDDTGTLPTGSYYTFVVTLTGLGVKTFTGVLSVANGTSQGLFTLQAFNGASAPASPYVAQILAGTGVTITPVTGTGQVTITAAATAGVTEIVAGTNVTITPSGGTGAVTINAASGTSAPVQPTVVGGTAGVPLWDLVFDDEFTEATLDPTRWSAATAGTGNGVTFAAGNVAIVNDMLELSLSDATHGACVVSSPFSQIEQPFYPNIESNDAGASIPVGGFVEAKINFAGSGTVVYNWPAWWAVNISNLGPSSEYCEFDIFEGLGQATCNYHDSAGQTGPYNIAGTWTAGFHTYGLWRQSANKAIIYWDGVPVQTIVTADPGKSCELRFELGVSGTVVLGVGIQIDYCRAWIPGGTLADINGAANPVLVFGGTTNFNGLGLFPISPSHATVWDLTVEAAFTIGNPGQFSATPNAPFYVGMPLDFILRYGATPYVVTLGSAYKAVSAIPDAANTVTRASFRYDGTYWRQAGAFVTTPA